MTEEEYRKLREDRGKKATFQQRNAANPLQSVWVEASAGTGKTKVLSDRVLRLLLNEVNPIRLLCLTYTKAAAVEMNTRISERLSKWSVISDEMLEKSLYELLGEEITSFEQLQKYKKTARTLFAVLLDTPGGIKIQTLHSFCQEVLKRFPLEAGISPYFEVLEDESSNEALEQIRKEILTQSQNNPNNQVSQALIYLSSHIKEQDFPKIMTNITADLARIADMLKKYGSKENFAQALSQKLEIDINKKTDELFSEFMQKIDDETISRNITALLHGGKKDCSRAEILAKIRENGYKTADYNQYYKVYCTAEMKPLAQMASKNTLAFDADISERMYLEATRIIELEKTLKKRKLYEATIAVFTIAEEIETKYLSFKQQRACLDFSDLIQITCRLLSDSSVASWVLYKLDGGIDHILLDEAQDTSPLQWDIIKSLSSEFFAGESGKKQARTVFVVGDRKQSIYSFQGADPEKFDTMFHYFADKGGDKFSKVNLEVSFRSSSAVLDLVNRLFANSEVSNGVIAEGEVVNHLPFRAGEYGHVEIWPLVIADKNKDTQDWQPPVEMSREVSLNTMLAQKVANKIKSLHDESIGTLKPLNYSDFMVLVQSRSRFVDEFIRACKNVGVNISGADKLKLTEQIVVQDLVSLGKFLLLPTDDLSLAEVLKSPLFGLDDDDLTTLCYQRGNTPLWSRLGNNPRYNHVYCELQTLFNMLDFVRPYELYNYVLTKMNGRYKFTQRMGVEVEDSLDEFINLTIDYEQEHIPSLQEFISWISKSSVVVKRETEQKDTDAVRLMTVHHSKGLQAPIVFLPDAMRIKNTKREQAMLWDKEFAYYPLNSDYYDNNCENIKEYNKQKSIEEYRRLLYVALTRAEDRLYICGCSKKEEIDKSSWYELCRQCLSEYGEEVSGNIISETPEVIAKRQSEKSESQNTMPQVESWIENLAPIEESLAKPYTPSKMEDEEELDSSSPLSEGGNFYRRGTIIHSLLQFLPQTNGDKIKLINDFLAKNATDFSAYQKRQIKEEVMQLLNNNEFSEVFGEHSSAEVPIVGVVDNKVVSARIDRLVILPDRIMVIDFKTNRPPAQTVKETPLTYINQLTAYAELLQRIYPKRKVETYILWTNETRMMRVS